MRLRTTENATTNTTNNATVDFNMLSRTVISNTYSMCGKKIASVPVALMAIDDTYQRVLGNTVKKLMEEWNEEKCNFLLVSFREGKFYIIDGQHRYSVAKAKGIVELPCIILTGLTQKDEALKFAQQQDNVNKLSPFDTFKANIACGQESIFEVQIDMEIKRICDKYNIVVKKVTSDQIKALRTLDRARRFEKSDLMTGTNSFEWIIDTINATNWADLSISYSAAILELLRNFWIDNANDKEVCKKLVTVMNNITPEELIAAAKAKYPTYNANNANALYLRDLLEA